MNLSQLYSVNAGYLEPRSQRLAFQQQGVGRHLAPSRSSARNRKPGRCLRTANVQASNVIVDTIAQLRCSEDALVVWVGSNISKGVYGGWQQNLWVLSIIYFGVVVSDMVTFYMGVGLKMGFFKKLKSSLFSNSKSFDRAINVIKKRSRTIGAIQRFSLGFRGPLCLCAGFTGVSPKKFALGAAVGALGTMPLQLTVGHFLRDTPNLYLTALAIMSAPNLFGQLVGPVASALGLYFAGKEQANPASPKSQQTTTESAQKPS